MSSVLHGEKRTPSLSTAKTRRWRVFAGRISGNAPVLKETTHWYLPLEDYEPWLREWILEGHKEWKVNVYGQCKSWIDAGLHPRAVTRDLDWGVKVPLEEAKGKVLYVWFDAPL